MRAWWLIASFFFCWLPTAFGEDEPGKTKDGFAENLILITIDGLRPEEFFGGADSRLFLEELGVKDPQKLHAEYRRDSREAARKALLPFLWESIEQGGWAAGDWTLDSKVQVTNGHYFSYPGYSEILCGFADKRIDSNDKKYNPNQTFLEWLHRREAFSKRVMAFTSWDVFPYIINDRRSAIPVNSGWQALEVGEPQVLAAYNYVADNIFREWEGVRYDAFTTAGAIQAMRTQQPRVLFVALGEPDDWAHAGRYDRYLLTARQNDAFIRQLWEQAEALPAYAGKTAFLVTTDHGRGDGREGWKSHGRNYPGSERIWVAAFGKGLSARGIDRGGAYQQAQIAASAVGFLGLDYRRANAEIAEPLPCVPSQSD